jgi:hypothetical protein
MAYTIIHADNAPSLASYRAPGFAVTTRVTRTRWLGVRRERVAPVATVGRALPAFVVEQTASGRQLRPGRG